MARTKVRRVLMLTYSLGGGGAERTMLTLAQSMAGVEVLLVSCTARVEYDLSDVLVDCLGIDVLAQKTRKGRVDALRCLLSEYASVKRAWRPDVVLSFGFWPNLIASVVRGDERLVLSVRSTLRKLIGRDRSGPVFESLVRLLFPSADGVVALAKGVEYELGDDYGVPSSKLHTIYNPVDVSRLDSLVERDVVPSHLGDRPWVLTVGRMVQAKGQWHLIRVFARLVERRSTVALVILGEGPFRGMLEELAVGLGLRVSRELDEPGAHVYMPGFVDNPYAFMARASLFAFPSLWEGLGNSLLEAMGCGAPVCAADCDFGPRELIAPGVGAEQRASKPYMAPEGILLPVFDGEHHGAEVALTSAELAWADALTVLLEDEVACAQMGERARARVLRDFALDEITNQWARVLFA